MGYRPLPKAEVLREALEEKSKRPKQPLLTLKEAAEYLRTSTWTIYRLLDANQLKSVRIRSRRLIPEAELQRYVTTQLAEGAA